MYIMVAQPSPQKNSMFQTKIVVLHGIYSVSHIIRYIYLVVSTHSKNISQIGSFPQVGLKIKNIWNHHPDIYIYINTTTHVYNMTSFS